MWQREFRTRSFAIDNQQTKEHTENWRNNEWHEPEPHTILVIGSIFRDGITQWRGGDWTKVYWGRTCHLLGRLSRTRMFRMQWRKIIIIEWQKALASNRIIDSSIILPTYHSNELIFHFSFQSHFKWKNYCFLRTLLPNDNMFFFFSNIYLFSIWYFCVLLHLRYTEFELPSLHLCGVIVCLDWDWIFN